MLNDRSDAPDIIHYVIYPAFDGISGGLYTGWRFYSVGHGDLRDELF
jgi:hypothetical protein